MKTRISLLFTLTFVWAAAFLMAQQPDIVGGVDLTGGRKPAIALPDFRGTGDAQPLMNAFNSRLFSELEGSGALTIAPKGLYPLQVPRQPEDFKPPTEAGIKTGPWLTDWSGAPVQANYLAFGYASVQNGRMALFGWLFDVTQKDVKNANVFGKIYFGSLNDEGANKVAVEFATDILAKLGFKSLAGSRIFFVSDRSGTKEIWSMDYDGQNQRQMTRYGTVSISPALSPDNAKIAFTRLMPPSIMVHAVESGRRLTFVNPQASMNATPEFLPDGRMIFSSTLAGGYANLYVSGADGSGLRRLTDVRAIDVEPRVNPKNPREVAFISGRGGRAQLYKMSVDGGNVERLTSGAGEVANPAWSPDGQFLAYSTTAGHEPGNWSIMIMNLASRRTIQLTSGVRSENPSWGPDGRHIVFSRTAGRGSQLFSMLADGTQVKQLTHSGSNEKPVWTR
jgi:TolB protein